MQIVFKDSFKKDLRKSANSNLCKKVMLIINEIEKAQNIHQINNIAKLSGTDNYFRIRIGDYRLGLLIEHNSVIFVRLLHRREIYKYFP